MMRTPTKVVMEVMSCEMPWFKLCPKVSTSLVMRERVSPTLVRSKYPTGSLSIFWDISRRNS